MAALMIVPVYVAQMSGQDNKIAIIDETGIFFNKFKNSENITFENVYCDLESAKTLLKDGGFYALLYIQKTNATLPSSAVLYSGKQVNIMAKSYIEDVMKKEIEGLKLAASGIDQKILDSAKSNISLLTIKLDKEGKEEKSYTEISMVIGMFSGILIYFFIFFFGAQVMRGVIEEKTSRIVEVIVSSVKPFELMLGKIIGVALVGLTQFLLWVILTFGIFTVFQTVYSKDLNKLKTQSIYNSKAISTEQILNESGQSDVTEVFDAISSVNFVLIIASFLFYFLGGYLLYAALFAAVGAAVDSEADTQQFMLPLTIPLIFSIIMAQYVINNPDGQLSFWLSIVPLTSPIIMMIRIPFGVSPLELSLSMILLVLGFLGTTWIAAKIYRVGILMYGKKVDYKELRKWITYKS